MPLLGEERIKLHEALRAAFPRRAELRMFLSFYCEVELDDIDDGSPYAEAVFNVIRWAESAERVSELIDKALSRKPHNPQLKAMGPWLLSQLRKRNSSSIPIPPDPFEAWLLRGGQPFVNRQALRDYLRELSGPNGSRVLAVAGPPGSGKSYSVSFISHISESLKSSRIIWIDVEQTTRATLDPDQVAVRIVTQMGRRASLSFMPRKGESPAARWLVELRDWIVGEVNQTDTVWWLVFDGLCHPDVPLDTRDLLRHLIRITHVNVPKLRVIILACTDDILPPDILPFIRRELISNIGRLEVREYFERLSKARIVNADSTALDEAVTIVLQRIPNGNVAALAAALSEATRLLREPRML